MSAAETVPVSLPELEGFARPRWREDAPALWRDNTSIQLGDDVIVMRVSRAHIEWMSRLDGLRSAQQVEDELVLPEDEARRLLRAMLAAGALEDAARIPDSVRWAAQADRDLAGRRFGAALRTTRDLNGAYAAMAARDSVRVLVLGEGDLAEQLSESMSAAGLQMAAQARHATIVVLADGHHPDVPAHFDHDLQDLPHVHLGVLGDRAIVGPLVVPGQTSCLRCAHLHRRDADPAWPLLAVQWAQVVASLACPPIDPLLVRTASSHAALLVRMWADSPDEPEKWANRALELKLPDGRVIWLDRPPHALCGCRWPTA
jgi:hypothetical protein